MQYTFRTVSRPTRKKDMAVSIERSTSVDCNEAAISHGELVMLFLVLIATGTS